MDASTQVNPELSQIQNRLLNLTNQIEHIHANIDRLTTDMQSSGIQLDALTRNLTAPDANPQATEHWSQMFDRLEEYHDKMDNLLNLTKQSAGSQQLNELAQALAQTNDNVARNQEQLDELAKSLKKLTRTQFKANTLGENKDQHINSAVSTLQDMATRRESANDEQILQNRAQMDQARKEGRTELVAEMLPAMDSLERALDSGASLNERQKQEVEHYLNNTSLEVPTPTPMPISVSTRKKSGWSRLVSALAGVESEPQTQYQQPAFSDTVSVVESEALAKQAQSHADNLSQMTASSDAWLDGLQLVRKRFLSVLASENVEPIPAMGEQFDPRLHVAVASEDRQDVPNNTIIGVTRAGYYQDGRVLRYAEVSVSRGPEPVVVLPPEEESTEDDSEDGSLVGGAILGGAALGAAVVAAELLDDEDQLEPEESSEFADAEIIVEDVDILTSDEDPSDEADAEAEIIVEDVDILTSDEGESDEADSSDETLLAVEAETAVDEPEPMDVEEEVVLSPSQMPDYVPAVSKTYEDEYADVRKQILGLMFGEPAEANDGDDAVPIETETASASVEAVPSDEPVQPSTTEQTMPSAAPATIFDTDEQVSMNRETDHQTFMASDTTDYPSMSSQAQTMAYPDKTNVQSEISWVQYESPKRGSWISRLFGN